MSVYKLYIHKDGRQLITKNDFVFFKVSANKPLWSKSNVLTSEFMAGDLALDNGFECKGKLTEAEVFAELL